MSPISVSTFYSFSFLPSIMHRLESILLALNLKKMQSDHYTQNVIIPSIKILEAITTKKCQEEFSLESLETLGDSFLKYAVGQHLFKTYSKQHEGLLSTQKDKMISNAALCKLGCDRKLPGFIRNECFDTKKWVIPGDCSRTFVLEEVVLSSRRKIYDRGSRHMKIKVVADVVEALIGAYLSTGGEYAAVLFMDWLGLKVDFVNISLERPLLVRPGMHVNISHLQSLLKYPFRDPSLLVEALTHGSYMLQDIPTCYQRLEFLGDSVLDYLITRYLYSEYPGLSPGLLTDLRSSSVNNDCYAHAAVRAGLHKHILHASSTLHKEITGVVDTISQLSSNSTFGFESEIAFPKVLGDIMESLAGAIYVDSGCDKDIVWEKIRPLLEPLVTPETVKPHPVRELLEICQKMSYNMKTSKSCGDYGTLITIEVEANGVSHCKTFSGSNKKIAMKLAAKAVLESLKANPS